MDRVGKERLVASLNELFGGATLLVVTRPVGLTVAQSTGLRAEMRRAGAGFKVTKNRLTRRALEGTVFAPLADLFAGPTAIAYSRDPVAAAKVAVTFAEKNDELSILGGALERRRLDAAEVVSLAKLPSLDELRAGLIGVVQAPAARIASVLQAPGGQLARALRARATQDEAA